MRIKIGELPARPIISNIKQWLKESKKVEVSSWRRAKRTASTQSNGGQVKGKE